MRRSFFRIGDIRPYDLSDAVDHMPTEAAEVSSQSKFLNGTIGRTCHCWQRCYAVITQMHRGWIS
jgi:hypothetical protein